MKVKFTLDQLKSSKRLSKLEDEILEICKNAKKPKHYSEIKEEFPGRASLETTLSIIAISKNIQLYQEEYAFHGLTADITYNISGGDIYRILIGGVSGNPEGGTVYGAWISDDYEFSLDVNQNGHANWTFSTTSIVTSDGQERKSKDVVSADPDFYDEIPTF